MKMTDYPLARFAHNDESDDSDGTPLAQFASRKQEKWLWHSLLNLLSNLLDFKYRISIGNWYNFQ